MFGPNGRMIKELSDSLKAYMERTYPDSLGWNNNIVAVAHSRGGLDAENAIVLQGADIKGIVSLATPWFGSKIGNLCERGLPHYSCAILCILSGAAYPECLVVCEAMSRFASIICPSIEPDARILTTWSVSDYRDRITPLIQNSPIKYAGGIGYTTNWLCGGFEGFYVAGCFLMKYLYFDWANDGMVQGNSVYPMDNIYGSSKFEVISPQCTDYCHCPSPGMWVRDHTRVRESYDIFNNEVEPRVKQFGTQSTATTEPVDYEALNNALREARIVRSAGYITYLSSGDTLNLKLGRDVGISGIAILSEVMLQGINMDYCDTCLYKYSYQSITKDLYREMTLSTVDSGSVIIGFIPEDEEALMEMERDKLKYREGDSAVLTLRMPRDDYVITAYYINTDRMEGGDIQFNNRRAVIRNLREGIYMVGVQVEGRTYRRTLMMFFPVEEGQPSDRSMGYREETPGLMEGEYEVYDLNGRLIYRGYTDNGEVELEHLKKGIYLIKQGSKTRKVIVR